MHAAAVNPIRVSPTPTPVKSLIDVCAEVQDLGPSERLELARCEQIIAKGWETFVEVGKSLATIRDRRLYREQYKTFEVYCRQKWQYGKSYAYQLIGAAEVVTCLSAIADKPLPANEAQVRPLIGLPREQIRQVWSRAQETAGAKPLTARLIRQAAATFQQRDSLVSKPTKGLEKERSRSAGGATWTRVFRHLDELDAALRSARIDKETLRLLRQIRDRLKAFKQIGPAR